MFPQLEHLIVLIHGFAEFKRLLPAARTLNLYGFEAIAAKETVGRHRLCMTKTMTSFTNDP